MGTFTLHTYIHPVLQAMGGFDTRGVSLILVVFGISSVAGVGIGGVLTDRIGAIPTFLLTIGLKGVSLVSFSLLFFTSGMWMLLGLITAVMVWGAASWMLNPAVQRHLMTLAPQVPTVVLSLNMTFLYLGVGAGAVVGGWVLQWGSAEHLGWVGSALQMISLAGVLVSLHFVADKGPSANFQRRNRV